MTISFLKKVTGFFSERHVSCTCGGIITEEQSWGNAFYNCDSCDNHLPEKEFDLRYEAQK